MGALSVGELDAGDFIDMLLEMLESPQVSVASAAAHAFRVIQAGPQAVPALLRLVMTSPNVEAVTAAVHALAVATQDARAAAAFSAAIPRLVEPLSSADAVTGEQAASAVGNICTETARATAGVEAEAVAALVACMEAGYAPNVVAAGVLSSCVDRRWGSLGCGPGQWPGSMIRAERRPGCGPGCGPRCLLRSGSRTSAELGGGSRCGCGSGLKYWGGPQGAGREGGGKDAGPKRLGRGGNVSCGV